MNIFQRFLFNLAVKASASGYTLSLNPGQPVYSNRNYEAFSKEAYQRNVVGFAAINRTAEAISTIPIKIWLDEDKEAEDDHPLAQLLSRPNPMQNYAEWMTCVIGFRQLAGNSYMERVSSGMDGSGGEPKELWCLRPDRMKVIAGPEGIPSAYQYEYNSQKVRWDNDPVEGGDIRHIKTFNPLDDWYGMSPIEAGAYAVDQHNTSMHWMMALLQNSARPSGALVVDKDVELGSEQFQDLKHQIQEQYSGPSNAGRPMLLQGGMKWEQMGFAPKDMEALETKYSSARDVCLALGVPPQLLGIPGDNTYSNYQEARLAFYEDTVVPLIGSVFGEINDWLSPSFDGAKMAPDYSQVPAMADKAHKLWEMADNSTDLTIDERRELKGYPKLSDTIPGADGNVREATYRSLGVQAANDLPSSEGDISKDAEEQVKAILGGLDGY